MTNIVYLLTDILETNLFEMHQEYKKHGNELRHDAKRNFNAAIAAIKKLKRDVNHCSDTTQYNFGNDADMLNAIILTIIDRCGDDDIFTFKLFNYIKSFPSKLDMQVDNAFSHLFRKDTV